MNTTITEIKDLLEQSRARVAVQVNQELLITYWKIGEIIAKYEQNESIRVIYGAKTLTKEYGKGFSRSNFQNMRSFYLNYPEFLKCQSVTGKLTMDTLL